MASEVYFKFAVIPCWKSLEKEELPDSAELGYFRRVR